MATNLSDLISQKTKDKTTLEGKVNVGESAKAELAKVVQELETLGEVQSLHDAALTRATAMVKGSIDAVTSLKISAPYVSVSAAVDTGLQAKGKAESDLAGIVDKTTLPMKGTYKDYVSALSKADTALTAEILDEAAKRIALTAKRGMIDVRIAALTSYAAAIEARVAQAKVFLTSAILAAQTNSIAAAWWAFYHVKTILPEVAAADIATLATAVEDACKEYATAYNQWVGARDKLDKALADRAAAAATLAQADAQTLAALAAAVK